MWDNSDKTFPFINQNHIDKNNAGGLKELKPARRDYKPLKLGCALNKSRAHCVWFHPVFRLLAVSSHPLKSMFYFQ